MSRTTVMAKKKLSSKETKSDVVMTTRAFRMSESYAEWLEQAAAHDRSSVAEFLDRAAAHYAKAIGVATPPPDRNGWRSSPAAVDASERFGVPMNERVVASGLNPRTTGRFPGRSRWTSC